MKGKILEFNAESRTGVISGDNGSRYSYEINEWKGANLPKAGDLVDFSAKEEKAEAIYPDAPAANNNSGLSKRLVAALLAFFVGGLGIHKFYLGYKNQGIIILLVFFLGFILLGFPTIIISIVAFIEFVIYLLKSDEEFEQTYVVGRKGWF